MCCSISSVTAIAYLTSLTPIVRRRAMDGRDRQDDEGEEESVCAFGNSGLEVIALKET